MKILLIGEFSGLHLNLKQGLCKLGHQVTLAGGSDGFKKIPVDINFDVEGRTYIKNIQREVRPFASLPFFQGYDIVQLINPFAIFDFNASTRPELKLFFAKLFFKTLMQRNGKFFMLAAGDDAFFWRRSRNIMRYGPFDDFLKYDLKLNEFYMQEDRYYQFNKWLAEAVSGIIPVMYEYEVAYQGFKNLRPVIPLPINTDKIKYNKNYVNDKIYIFHGLNRYGFKGTRFVEEAFKILSERYPNDITCSIEGQLPLSEYLEIMDQTNIVIDQASSYSSGMNGLFALAMGKIVLGGAEPESLHSFGVSSSPIYNILPDTLDIVAKIETLIDQKSDFEILGQKSRNFVEEQHNYIKIAENYIAQWTQ